ETGRLGKYLRWRSSSSWSRTSFSRTLMTCRVIASTVLVFGLAHGHGLAQTNPNADSVCSRAATAFDIALPVPPPVAPLCHLDQGCLQVDCNVAAQQAMTETLKLYRFTENAPLRLHPTNVNLLQ